MEIYQAYYKSPLGFLEITGTERGILTLDFIEKVPARQQEVSPALQEAVKQIDQYFQGQRKEFSLPLELQGTDFQKQVWHKLMAIPFGQTRSYLDVAKEMGREKAARAVGNANNKNKIAIIIPCHRVIGSNGALTGYASGIWRKEWLLKHEQNY